MSELTVEEIERLCPEYGETITASFRLGKVGTVELLKSLAQARKEKQELEGQVLALRESCQRLERLARHKMQEDNLEHSVIENNIRLTDDTAKQAEARVWNQAIEAAMARVQAELDGFGDCYEGVKELLKPEGGE